MKKLFWSLIFVLSLGSPPLLAAESEEKELGLWVEAQAVSGKSPEKLILWYEKDFTDMLGFYALVSGESDRYRQFYVGPKVKPFDWLTIGVGIGRENFPNEFSGTRRNAYMNAELNGVSLWGIYETGPSGPWHKVTATYAVNERFGLGVMKEAGLGNGPRLEWNIRKNIQLWAAVLRGNALNADDVFEKKTTAMFAVNFSF